MNDSTNTESAAEVTPVFTPQKRKRAVLDSSPSSEFCGVCKVRYQSEEDIESDSHWLNCSKGCDWWVHSRYVGIHYENSDTCEKGLDKWAKDHYSLDPLTFPTAFEMQPLVIKFWQINFVWQILHSLSDVFSCILTPHYAKVLKRSLLRRRNILRRRIILLLDPATSKF